MAENPLVALEVAKHFLASVDVESGDNMTHLKLQKLLYYAQGFHVAMHAGCPLFPESLLAWKHGPVVRSVYSHYAGYEHRAIDPVLWSHLDDVPPETQEILDAVYANYGQYSARKLEEMTHEELPWRKTPQGKVISLDLLRDYFSPLVEAGRKGEAVGDRPVWPIKSFRFQGRKEISASMAPYRERLRATQAARAARVNR